LWQWVVPEKTHTPPTEEISAVQRTRGEKMFLIIVSVLGHPKGEGGLTSNFLRGGGMDVFWNDPVGGLGSWGSAVAPSPTLDYVTAHTYKGIHSLNHIIKVRGWTRTNILRPDSGKNMGIWPVLTAWAEISW
jgi:hypothetical protein